MSGIELKFDGFDQVKERIFEAVQKKHEEAVDSLLEFIVAALDAGEFGLQSDKHALASSLYVQATGRDDYAEARAQATKMFKAALGDTAGAEKSQARFETLFAERSALPDKGTNVFVAAVATMLSYGTHWETDGGRPWMSPAAYAWAEQRAKAIYEELKHEL